MQVAHGGSRYPGYDGDDVDCARLDYFEIERFLSIADVIQMNARTYCVSPAERVRRINSRRDYLPRGPLYVSRQLHAAPFCASCRLVR